MTEEIVYNQRGAPGEIVETRPATDLLARTDVRQLVERAEYMASMLTKLQAACIKATVPGDWVIHGSGDKATCYLEGDGGLRMAPIVGLRLLSPPRRVDTPMDNGVIAVTYIGDFESQLYGTVLYGVERTRRNDDDFLARKVRGADGEVIDVRLADVEDVASAAYKGLFARAAQLIAGLSGLSPTDLSERYGFDLKGSAAVKYRTGAGDAKKQDVENADENVRAIQTILRKLFGDDAQKAGDYLFSITPFADGTGAVRDPRRLSAKRAEFILKKVQAKEKAFDAEVAKNEGGAE